MKKYLQSEKGYTLILTLSVILLFTIVGASLMAATIGGAQKNKIRETDIQATELANNGVEYLTAQINTELKNALGPNGLPRDEFKNRLNDILNKYKTEVNRVSKNGDTGDYNVYITNIVDTVDKDGNPNPLRKKVTFISKGKANNNQKQVTSEIEIGAQSVLETLKYAVGANKCPEGKTCENLPGEGNMFLHGGVKIQGDFKVDGDLITSNRGYASYSTWGQKVDLWIDSQSPSVLPSSGSTTASLVLGGKLYSFNNKPIYDNHISRVSFANNSNYIDRTNNVTEAFKTGEEPKLVNRQIVRDDIRISEQKSTFYFSKNSGVRYIETTNDRYNQPYDFSQDIDMLNDKVYPRVYSCYRSNCGYSYDDHFTFTKNSAFKNFATDGSVTIKSNTTSFKTTKFTNGAYIDGNLIIGNGSDSYDITYYDKIKIDGPIFVNGNVTIKGANAQFNSIMYVTGNVTIENSQLGGLNSTGSLIIFAKGNMNLRNNSVNQDTPSNIKGFFYSEQALEIFGVGSNIRIEGGVSARRIVLNAIRGSAKEDYFNGAQYFYPFGYFEGAAKQSDKASRLQIIYDPSIMNTYADIKSREPYVTSVDPPQLINRE